MFWLSISNVAPALDPIAANTRPGSILRRFWQFCQSYGEYQATPPKQRRNFILRMEQNAEKTPCRSGGF
jgi:hypothetical protein